MLPCNRAEGLDAANHLLAECAPAHRGAGAITRLGDGAQSIHAWTERPIGTDLQSRRSLCRRGRHRRLDPAQPRIASTTADYGGGETTAAGVFHTPGGGAGRNPPHPRTAARAAGA